MLLKSLSLLHSKNLTSILTLAIILFMPAAHSTELQGFNAKFKVEALGMTLGLAKQSMRCKDNTCVLKSDAKPSGFAAMLSSDHSSESVTLIQKDHQLNWLSYEKLGFTKKHGQDYIKKESMLLQPETEQVQAFKNEKLRQTWPAKSNTFDSLSLAYAIQHAQLNKLNLDSFVLVDSKFQDALTITKDTKFVKIALAETGDSVEAEKYNIESEHTKIDLWLLPKYNHFPGKIRIVNQDDQTITFTLAEPPKYYETQ